MLQWLILDVSLIGVWSLQKASKEIFMGMCLGGCFQRTLASELVD
jgi:hypothetical protein